MRAIAKAPTTSRWFSLLMLACGGILIYLCAMASAMAGPVDKAVPTELKPVTPAEVKAPPPAKTVEVVPPVPVVQEPPPCGTEERSFVTYTQGLVVSVPGMLMSTCGCCGINQVWLNGVHVAVPGQALEHTSYKQVCK